MYVMWSKGGVGTRKGGWDDGGTAMERLRQDELMENNTERALGRERCGNIPSTSSYADSFLPSGWRSVQRRL
jgi:hypothetical protein